MGDFPILVKQYDGINEIVLAPSSAGRSWLDGYFYPWRSNINDFEPIVGAFTAAAVHQTFQGDGSSSARSARVRNFHRSGSLSVQSQQCGFRRSFLLCVERIHEPKESIAVSRTARTEFRTVHIRDAPRLASAQVHRRAGGDDGQLPPAEGGEQALEIEDKEYHKSWLQGQHRNSISHELRA